jgi:OOP family OmpA-OmpF porin
MKKIILAICCLAGISTAKAQDNYYVGAGITSSKYEVSINYDQFSNQNSVNQTGAKFFAGMVIDKTWAVETAYVDLGTVSTDWKFSGRAGTATFGATGQYIAGKGSLPLTEQFSLFGKLGLIRNQFKKSGFPSGVDETKTNAYGSIGAEYALSKKFSLSIEVERFGSDGTLTSALRFNF